MRTQYTLTLILFLVAISPAQTLFDDQPYRRHILLSDGEVHKLEIGTKGISIDGKLKASAKGPENKFQIVSPLAEYQEYWNDSGENGSNGIWFVFGTGMATGMCGMPTFAVAYVDSFGNVRLSAESPAACIGDWPSTIDFRFLADSKCENGYPVWKLSNALEFDGCSFSWKELRRTTRATPRRKK